MISDDLISLKPFDSSHAEQTRLWLNDPEICKTLGRIRTISDIEQKHWIESLHEKGDCFYFAIESNKDQKHIGNIWLFDVDLRNQKSEVRIVLGPQSTGKGYGVAALKLLQEYGFTWLNLQKLYAFVLSSNERAHKAFEKAGFDREATLKRDRYSQGTYIDVHILSCFKVIAK